MRVWPALIPRLITLGWAGWAAATSYAYISGAPDHLLLVERIVHMPIWIMWAVIATILTIGSIIPPGLRISPIGSWMRIIGMALIAAAVMLWCWGFFIADWDRGWVSAKNYGLIAVAAAASSWITGRETHRMVRHDP